VSPAGQPLADLGASVAPASHACAFFADEEAEYRALLPFARDCLACGEKCLNFLDPSHRQERLRRLAGGTAGAEEAIASGQLDVRTWQDSTLQGNRFDQDRMLALFGGMAADGQGSFPRTRLWANMEWSLSGLPGCEQLVEFESRLNTVLDRSKDIVLCVYDVRKYSARLVLDILCAHPMVVVGERLRPNPLYVPPQRFLADYRQRRGLAGA
jgi:hypothetical protein